MTAQAIFSDSNPIQCQKAHSVCGAKNDKSPGDFRGFQERETRFELATSTLAIPHPSRVFRHLHEITSSAARILLPGPSVGSESEILRGADLASVEGE